jgi:hypothetical protein
MTIFMLREKESKQDQERMRSTKNPNSPSAKDFKQAAKTVIKKKK